MSERKAAVSFLLESDGPIVRWLALDAFVSDPDPSILTRARKDVLQAPHVRLWLDRVAGVRRFHNSGNDCFENVAGKLFEFGLRAGMADLDSRMARFRKWIADPARSDERGMMAELNRVLCCAGLLRLGYTDDALRKHALRRINTIHRVAASGRFDVLLAEDPIDLPKAYRGRHSVVDPWFTSGGASALPNIYDLHLLGALPEAWLTPPVCDKIDTIVRYVLTDAYQAFPSGFGYIRDDSSTPSRFYILGWNADLPGFLAPPSGKELAYLVMRLELMSAFPEAWAQRWFIESRDRLDQHRTERGTWLLPRSWLVEKPVGYWVSGAHMGLEANRRSKTTIELESTLRVLRVLSRSPRLSPSK